MNEEEGEKKERKGEKKETQPLLDLFLDPPLITTNISARLNAKLYEDVK